MQASTGAGGSAAGEPGQAATPPASPPDVPKKSAGSPFLRIASGVSAVLAVATALAFWKLDHRDTELTAHYARAVARAARQVEIRFESYSNNVDSLASVAQGAGPASRAVLLAQNAEVRANELKLVLDAAEKQKEAARKLATEAEKGSKEAIADLTKADDELALLKRGELDADNRFAEAVTRARQAVDQAKQKRNLAQQKTELAAKLSQDHQDATRYASETATAAQSQADQAATAHREAALLGPDQPQSELSANPALAPTRRELADRAAEKAQVKIATADAATEAASTARAAARTALTEAADAEAQAALAEEQAVALFVPLLRQKVSVADATEQHRKRRQKQTEQLAKSLERQEDLNRIEAKQKEHAQALGALTLDALKQKEVSDSIVNDVLSSALPSYYEELKQCLNRPLPELRTRCLARSMARLGGLEESALDYLTCPPNVQQGDTDVQLSLDRTQVIFPKATQTGVSVGCASVALASLVPRKHQPAQATPKEVSELDELVLLDRQGNVIDADPASRLRLEKLPGFDPKAPLTTSVNKKVSIGGTEYRVFLQPVQVDVKPACGAGARCDAAKTQDAAGFVAAGLVEEERIATESRRLTPAAFLWVVLFVAFALLSVPLGKLWLLGPNSSFSHFDAALLATAAGIAALLTVLGLWAFNAHARLDRQIDDTLRSVSDSITTKVSNELEQAATTLTQFNEDSTPLQTSLLAQTSGTVDPGRSSAAPDAVRQHCRAFREGKAETSSGITEWSGFGPNDEALKVCEVVNYRPLKAEGDNSQLFLIDRNGHQLAKFAAGKHATTPVSVESRDYFKRALEKRVSCLTANCKHSLGTSEILRASTTGEILLVVAQPTKAEGQEARGVAAIASDLSVLSDLLLPRGFSMAVIDRNGGVLLHSDNETQHGHDFLEDVADAEELKAVMHAELKDSINTEYLGTPVRMYLRHLPGPDWYVVTMAPKSLANLPVSDMVLVALGASVALLLIELVGALVLLLLGSFMRSDRANHAREGSPLFRPNSAIKVRYGNIGLAVFVAAMLTCFLSLLTPWLPLLVILILQIGIACVAIKQLLRPALASSPPEAATQANTLDVATPKTDAPPTSTGRRSRALATETTPERPSSWIEKRLRKITLSWRKPRLPTRTEFASNSLALCYSLWWFALVGVFLIAPASLFFAGAYDLMVENEARANQAHVVRLLRDHPACLARATQAEDKQANSCPNLIVPDKPRVLARAAELGKTGVSLHSASTEAPRPEGAVWFHLVKEALAKHGLFPIRHWLGDLQLLGSRDHADAWHYRDERERQLSYRRNPGVIELSLDDPDASFKLAAAFPGLHQFKNRELSTALLSLCVLGFLVGAFAVLYVSLRRLFFLELMAGLGHEAEGPSLEDLVEDAFAESHDERSLVLAHNLSPGRLEKLLEHYQAEVRAGSVALLDLDELLKAPAGFSKLPSSGKVLLLSRAGDPIQDLSPEARVTWAEALQECVFVTPPARIDEHLGCGKPVTPAYLTSLWASCSLPEQRVLGQLVMTGFITPHPSLRRGIERLARRGIIDPKTFTVAHPAVVDFVRAEIAAGRFTRHDDTAVESLWDQLKAPLLAAVALACAALGVSEPELVATGILAPTLAAGMPAALRALSRAATRAH